MIRQITRRNAEEAMIRSNSGTSINRVEPLRNKTMKIFELRWTSQDEKEWVAANTNIEALKTYLSITSTKIVDLENDDEIVEIPEEKWDEMKMKNLEYDETDPDDWKEKTFAQWMKEHTKPDIIAGTMYE